MNAQDLSTMTPKMIWLQHGCDDPEEIAQVDWQGGGVSWCWENIHGNDIEYILASNVEAREKVLLDALEYIRANFSVAGNVAYNAIAAHAKIKGENDDYIPLTTKGST